MGQGIDLARHFAPEHAELLDNFKDQLLIVLIKRLGSKVAIPVTEVDATGNDLLMMSLVDGRFNFSVAKKQ